MVTQTAREQHLSHDHIFGSQPNFRSTLSHPQLVMGEFAFELRVREMCLSIIVVSASSYDFVGVNQGGLLIGSKYTKPSLSIFKDGRSRRAILF
jgi:hypothetical protein